MTGDRLNRDLFDSAAAFGFFQAVRMLEADAARHGVPRGIGGDNPPDAECVRLRTRPSLGFAATDVVELRPGSGGSTRAEMDVAFLGFVGPAGVLPQRYTELTIERLQLRDPTLRDWLDLFHHRVLSLFYRAWCKYRFPFAFERERREHRGEDTFTRALFSLVGLGDVRLRGRAGFADSHAVFAGGLFARKVRSAQGLGQALSDLLGVPVHIEEFVGRWLDIPDDERCILPVPGETGDHRVALGGGATLGSRCFDVQSRISIQLGPLSLSDYERLCDHGPAHREWTSFTQFYLGLEHDFVIRYELAPWQSPGVTLAASGAQGASRLGSNTWLESTTRTGESRFALASSGHSGAGLG